MHVESEPLGDWDGLAELCAIRNLDCAVEHPFEVLLGRVDELVGEHMVIPDLATRRSTLSPLRTSMWSTGTLVVMLCGRAGTTPDRAVDMGAIAQLLRAALNEHARVSNRRSMNETNTSAILTGDFIFSRVALLAAKAGSEVVEAVSNVMSTIIAGAMVAASGKIDPRGVAFPTGIQRGSSAFTRCAFELGMVGRSVSQVTSPQILEDLCKAIDRRNVTEALGALNSLAASEGAPPTKKPAEQVFGSDR